MAALRIHQHGIDRVRIALPFEPRTFRPAGKVRRLALLDHHAFDDRMRRLLAQPVEAFPLGERDLGREVEARRIERAEERLQKRRAAR